MQNLKSASDKPTVAALMRMKAQEMKPLLTFFETMKKETHSALLKGEGAEMHRLQGRALMINEFLDAVENSAAVMEKLR
jgi:hypothetical protein